MTDQDSPPRVERIRIDLLNIKMFGIEILPQQTSEFQYTLALLRGLPEKKYLSGQNLYRVPVTPFNVKYLLERFLPAEMDVSEDAALLLSYTEKTELTAQKRERRRWQYMFEDQVPDWEWLSTGDPELLPGCHPGTDIPRYPIRPYRHQIVAADACVGSEFFALLMEQGTGKTLVMIEDMHHILAEKRRNGDKTPVKALIVCPSTLAGNELKELRKCRNVELTELYTHRLKISVRGVDGLLEGMRDRKSNLKVWVTNYERIDANLDSLMMMGFDVVYFDESNACKNGSAKRTKANWELAQSCERRRIMTGTIMANSVMDVWAQFELLNPGCLGYSTFAEFKRRYGRYKKHQNWDKLVGYKDLDELKERMARHSFIVTKERCLDLPPKVYETVTVPMSDRQQDLYMDMVNDYAATIEGDEAAEGKTVTAAAAIAMILRLSQITSGFIKTPEGETVRIPGGVTPKAEALLDIVNGADGKIIIWCRFREDIRYLKELLESKGYGVLTMHGGVSTKVHADGSSDRDRIVDKFNEDNDKRIFIGEPGTGGIGLTLLGPDTQRCRTMIYFSHDWSLMKREQSEDRFHRIGQDASVTIYSLACEASIDVRILSSTFAKKNLAEELVDVSTIKNYLLFGTRRPVKEQVAAKQSLSGIREIFAAAGIRIPMEPGSQEGCKDFTHAESGPTATCPHCDGDPKGVPASIFQRFLDSNAYDIDLVAGTVTKIEEPEEVAV